MKLVVLDGYALNPGDLNWDGLKDLGDCTIYDRAVLKTTEETIERIGDAEIVFTNKTPLTKEVLDACPGIRYIGVLATGYNVVDLAAAREKRIPVTNIPSYGTAAVAQFATALLLEVCHRIGHHNQTVHDGKWAASRDFCYWDYPSIELAGKTLGIIGFGSIGQAFARIAQALGMKVLAHSRTRHPELESEGCRYADLDEIFAQADIISLHCPLFPETEHMINRESIAKMKDGVILLNTARGALIAEQDLADALRSGKVAAAAVDVVSSEPIQEDNPLLSAPNCIITPHIAWAPRETRERLMSIAVDNLKAFLDGKPVNVVN